MQLPWLIYLKLPPGYQKNNQQRADKVMKITTSLYGDSHAANLWYNKICRAVKSKELGFRCLDFDPCLFIWDDRMMCLYVDDAIIHAQDQSIIEKRLKDSDCAGFAFSRNEDFSLVLL